MEFVHKVIGRLKFLKQQIFGGKRYSITVECRKYLTSLDKEVSPLLEEVKLQVLDYLSKYLIEMINAPFVHKYLYRRNKVYWDSSVGLRYVLHNNKRLYFKRNMSVSKIRYAYNYLCIEQDSESPHSYSFDKVDLKGKIVADIGCAEGIWALDIVDEVKELYLFECDEEWIEALEQTFSLWSDKVHIVRKFVSDRSEGDMISLDDFFLKNSVFLSVLKADIEGAEISMLKGAEKMLLDKQIKDMLICTYHTETDYHDISCILKDKEYFVNDSNGYLAMIYGNISLHTIFRKGVIHASC